MCDRTHPGRNTGLMGRSTALMGGSTALMDMRGEPKGVTGAGQGPCRRGGLDRGRDGLLCPWRHGHHEDPLPAAARPDTLEHVLRGE